MIEIIEQKEWHNHQLIKQVVRNETSEPVPFLTVSPTNVSGLLPCIIALHGHTSNKEDWLEFDEYTKAGNLVKALADNGYAVVAIDLYGHGENHTETPIDYDELVNDGWETFFQGSLESIDVVMSNIFKQETFDQNRIGFLSYSLGGLFGFWLANRNTKFKTMVMCVLPVDKDEDDEYAPFNNLDNLGTRAILLIAGEKDDYIALEDSKWLYEQLPVKDKQFRSYPSDHSLPLDYVPVALDWFKKWL